MMLLAYVLHLLNIKYPVRKCDKFCFKPIKISNNPTGEKVYIYPDISNFCCISFIPDVPGIILLLSKEIPLAKGKIVI